MTKPRMSNDESIIGDTQGTTTWATVDMILPPGKWSFLREKSGNK